MQSTVYKTNPTQFDMVGKALTPTLTKTPETICSGGTVRDWFWNHYGEEKDIIGYWVKE